MELSLGLWLMASPLVFAHGPAWLWAHDLGLAALLVTAALLSHWWPLRRVHLVLVGAAAWLVAAGWWGTWRAGGVNPPGVYQNWILVGMTLAMLAIVPSHATRPPDPWRERGG